MTDTHWKTREVLGYLRCSKDEQRDSIAGQRRILETELSRCGLTFRVPPFQDDGRRGSDEERPAFLALLDYCRRHPNRARTVADFIPIFCQSTDRIGRFLDPMKVFTYLNELKEFGYDVYCLTERLSYVRCDIGSRIQFVVKSDQATGYSVRLSHDSMRGALQTTEKGFSAGGGVGYGYDRAIVGADGKPRARYRNVAGKKIEKYAMDGALLGVLEPYVKNGKLLAPSLDKSNVDHVVRIPGEPSRVRGVERLFELWEQGFGLRTVAARLNTEGVPPPRGRKWSSSSVRFILTNPVYMGALVYGRRSKSKYNEFTVGHGKSGSIAIDQKEIFRAEFTHRELGDCLVIEDAHEALIAKDRWWSAQERLAAKSRDTTPKRTGRGARSPYLLTGLLKCARCGYNYQGDTHRRTGWKSYQCGGYVSGGRSICTRGTVPAEKIEDWLAGEMGVRLLDGRAALFESREDLEAAIAVELATHSGSAPRESDVRGDLEQRIAAKERKLTLIIEGIEADNLDVVNEALRTLKREISSLKATLDAMGNEAPVVTLDAAAIAHEAAGYFWNIKEVLAKGTVQERRSFVEYFVASATVNSTEGWVDVRMYARPALPGVPFCSMPPTGLEPVSRP